MNRNIVFVDDEPRILEGLERMLYGMRRDWNMRFATSGPQALDLLEESPADVVVSDMRMPQMGGVELLSVVMDRYPRTVRIILSGQSDRDEIMRSVGSSHQFLSKPCTPEALKSTIARACALRDLLVDESLQRLVTQLQTLPSLPSLYVEVLDELKSPTSSVTKVGNIIGRDIAMTAKILQLVNSSYFGLRRRANSASDAVRLLGLDTIKALVLSAGIFDQFDPKLVEGLSLESLWAHSLETGVIAQAIARTESADRALADEALLAGCLHDIGKVILAINLGDPYLALLKKVVPGGPKLHELERHTLAATHGQIGAYLLGLWGLNDSIVEAVAFHDTPGAADGDKFTPLTAVHVANAISHGHDLPDSMLDVDRAYLQKLNLEDRIAEWRLLTRDIGQQENDS